MWPGLSAAAWSLAGKTDVITGGSRGIGSAIAIHLASKGLSKLAITYVGNLASAESTLEECRKNGIERGIAIQADILDPSIGPDLIQQVLTGLETPTIDILVNNAAYLDPTEASSVEESTLNVFQKFAKEKAATFNTVCVGPTVTDGFKAVGKLYPDGFMEELAKEFTAAHRVGTPEDIAYIVGFLACEEARWVNGACMSANGGFCDVLPALS
ncbi:hypothetical protein BDW59DRAFT_175740 [Aspergillus cavernicola]|uniref:NAD(P)-binding protein n=1 Tax=Aspergillus cavernicola TaxID=176166 RepID=A0ABR4HMR5_9EURO